MNLPKQIKVACFFIKVEDWQHHSANAKGCFGEFSCLENIIRIDTTVDRIKVVDTFIHEINHAIYWAYGMEDDDKEERIVGTFATAWVQIYQDNPELLIFIQSMLKSVE